MSWKPLLLLGGVIALGGAAFVLQGETSNCGGNSFALSKVTIYVVSADAEALDSLTHSFQITTAIRGRQREIWAKLAARRLPPARFLVSTAPVTMDEKQPRHVIIVCNTPYTNVPERWFGKAPPTHAAGFSDGSTALISPAEFAALSLSSFVPLDTLYPEMAKK